MQGSKTTEMVAFDEQFASAREALNNVHEQRSRLFYAAKGQSEFPSEQGARYLQKMTGKYNEAVQQVRGMFRIVQGGLDE